MNFEKWGSFPNLWVLVVVKMLRCNDFWVEVGDEWIVGGIKFSNVGCEATSQELSELSDNLPKLPRVILFMSRCEKMGRWVKLHKSKVKIS